MSRGADAPDSDTVLPTTGGTHGDHWHAVLGERVGGVLELAGEAFRHPLGRGTVQHEGQTHELTLAKRDVAPGVDLVAAALDGALATAFPMTQEAALPRDASLVAVAPWPNGLEAWVEAHLEGLGFATFYPVDYITKQSRYHDHVAVEAAREREGGGPARPVRVQFSGLAYNLNPGTEDDQDDLAPASDMVPKAFPDDYWWTGTVKRIEKHAEGYMLHVRIEPQAGAVLELPVFARVEPDDAFQPREGGRASGFMWLQGRLAETGARMPRP